MTRMPSRKIHIPLIKMNNKQHDLWGKKKISKKSFFITGVNEILKDSPFIFCFICLKAHCDSSSSSLLLLFEPFLLLLLYLFYSISFRFIFLSKTKVNKWVILLIRVHQFNRQTPVGLLWQGLFDLQMNRRSKYIRFDFIATWEKLLFYEMWQDNLPNIERMSPLEITLKSTNFFLFARWVNDAHECIESDITSVWIDIEKEMTGTTDSHWSF